ncbi:MAG TPA: phosphoribosyltransferase family protein [Candidatus Saccharimonadales bacterium]|nr:phosphoribosyltransferase family protein [Candidatus Saccharimonadales bacterium]
MNEKQILKIFRDSSALITNSHLIYTSGKHGDTYVNKDAIYPHTKWISMLCKEIAERFKNEKVDVVIAPAIGGVILSQWVAYHLSKLTDKEVLAVYAEKTEDGKDFIIKRGYNKIIKSSNVLIVEDIVTTGGSVKKVVAEVKKNKGKVVGVAILCNRGNIKKSQIGKIPRLEALITLNLQDWHANDCPLCKQNIPINKDLGKGKNKG